MLDQAELGGAIRGHVSVVVEVVAGEVGEHGHIHRDAVEPVLVQRVRRRLEDDHLDAVVHALAQPPREVHGPRGRQPDRLRVHDPVRADVSEGPDNRRTGPIREEMPKQERRRGLPVRAGDRGQFETLRGPALEPLRRTRRGGPAVLHDQTWDIDIDRPLADHSRGAGVDRSLDEVVPVHGSAAPGDEQVTGSGRSGVVRYP